MAFTLCVQVSGAHSDAILCVDWSGLSEQSVLTGGQDGNVCEFDIRLTGSKSSGVGV